MHKLKKGTLSELILSQELIMEGYCVFWPIEGTGPCDIVAIHPQSGSIRLIDVKTLSRRSADGTKIYRTPTKVQKRIGVEIIEVDLDEHINV